MTEQPNLLTGIANLYRPNKSDNDCWYCWEFLMRGIEVGWVDEGELQRLLDDLVKGEDPGVEELNFEYAGWEVQQDRLALLRVRFLDETASCRSEELIRRIRWVLEQYAKSVNQRDATQLIRG